MMDTPEEAERIYKLGIQMAVAGMGNYVKKCRAYEKLW